MPGRVRGCCRDVVRKLPVPAGQLVCGVIGVTDNAFYADVYNGSSWADWVKIGGSGVSMPSCAALGTRQTVCTVVGPDNKLTSVVGPVDFLTNRGSDRVRVFLDGRLLLGAVTP